ncbi:MAG: MoeA C-terminal region, partial [Thermoleophilales bacterium]|nr:MoeA C-terminal region [Thermoleophilales bacterium]
TALLAMQGSKVPTLAEGRARLARGVKGAAGRESYLPARLSTDEDGVQIAEPLKWGGSSDFVGFVRATALIVLPPDAVTFAAGTKVRVVQLPD